MKKPLLLFVSVLSLVSVFIGFRTPTFENSPLDATDCAPNPLVSRPDEKPPQEEPPFQLGETQTQTGTAHTLSRDKHRYPCAPWIPKEQRKVFFVDLCTMEDYQKPTGYKGGEYYVSSSIDWALQQLDFKVEVVKMRRFARMNNFTNYRRFFLNTNPQPGIPAFKAGENHCKLRQLNFWPSYYRKGKYHPKQVVTAYPSRFHTFVGYFVHGLVEPEQKVVQKTGRHVVLFGKEPKHFVRGGSVMRLLLQHNYTLHATCSKCEEEKVLPDGVVNHKMLPPNEFDQLLRKSRFVLGFGEPMLSPTPLVAISKGTAFLNPLKKGTVAMREAPEQFKSQNNAVALMGKPYVYNYKQHHPQSALQAAEEATANPFQGYTPYEYRPEAMIARVCAILEDDSVCMGGFANDTNATMEIRAW